MDWVTKTRPDLSLTLLFPPFDLLESLTLLGIAVLDLTTVCFAGPIGTTVLNLQLSCKTTKPTLHYLHLSDFDTFIHAKLWGEEVQFRSVQTCVTCAWLERHSDASDLTVSLSASCMSHVFKACLKDKLSVASIYPRSWLIVNDDSLRDLHCKISR